MYPTWQITALLQQQAQHLNSKMHTAKALAVVFEHSGSCDEAAGWLVICMVALAWVFWYYRDRAILTPPKSNGTASLPTCKPILGDAMEALGNLHRFHDWLLESSSLMGFKTWALSLPTQPTYYVVNDPECLEYILRAHNDTFIKGPTFASKFGCLMGHGIFAADGEQWVWQRKLAVNILTTKSFRHYTDEIFATKLDLLNDRLLRSCSSGTPVDLHQLMHSFALDSFGQIGFGVNLGCLSSDGKVPFEAAFDRVQVVTSKRFLVPAWPLLELLTGKTLRMAADIYTIKQFAAGVIEQRRKQLVTAGKAECSDGTDDCADGSPPTRDLLSLFMMAKGPDSKPLTDKQLVDTVLNFIIAGRDTTAQALSWTFYELLRHPECESKVLSELSEVLQLDRNGNTVHPTYDQLRQLKYTKACFLEALRINPSVPNEIRFTSRDHVLPDKTFIPNNSGVGYLPYVINRLPSFWGDDAELFRPERWLSMATAPSPYNYATFNAGARVCLGQRLAELEGVYVLAGLLSKFTFKQTIPGQKAEYLTAATMPMKQGLHVYVTERC